MLLVAVCWPDTYLMLERGNGMCRCHQQDYRESNKLLVLIEVLLVPWYHEWYPVNMPERSQNGTHAGSHYSDVTHNLVARDLRPYDTHECHSVSNLWQPDCLFNSLFSPQHRKDQFSTLLAFVRGTIGDYWIPHTFYPWPLMQKDVVLVCTISLSIGLFTSVPSITLTHM